MTTATLTLTEFLTARIAERQGTERGDSMQHLLDLHQPADCGRHCDGHNDEEYPVWPCSALRWKAVDFKHHPDYSDEWKPSA